MQRISIAFIDVNSVKFAYGARIEERIYIRFAKTVTFMWPSVNGNVLTNQIDIRSEKTHEVTRCKQALQDSGTPGPTLPTPRVGDNTI